MAIWRWIEKELKRLPQSTKTASCKSDRVSNITNIINIKDSSGKRIFIELEDKKNGGQPNKNQKRNFLPGLKQNYL